MRRRLSRTLDGHVLFALVMLALFAYVLFETARLSARAQQFPIATALPAIALAAVQVVRELRAAARGRADAPVEGAVALSALAQFSVFFAAVALFGLLAAVPLFSLLYLRVFAGESWVRSAVYAAVAWAFTLAVFVTLLHVPLPAGIIPPLLVGTEQ